MASCDCPSSLTCSVLDVQACPRVWAGGGLAGRIKIHGTGEPRQRAIVKVPESDRWFGCASVGSGPARSLAIEKTGNWHWRHASHVLRGLTSHTSWRHQQQQRWHPARSSAAGGLQVAGMKH